MLDVTSILEVVGEIMNNWAMMAGGRCQDGSWTVGIVGYNSQFEGGAFLLSQEDWGRLQSVLPLMQLQSYGRGNGLIFEVVTSRSLCHYDAILLIESQSFSNELIEIAGNLRQYLLLISPVDAAVTFSEKFRRIFLPIPLSFCSPRLISFHQPIELPTINKIIKTKWVERPLIFGRDDGVSLEAAHFALCDEPAAYHGWISAQWQAALLAGAIPIHMGQTPVPEWFSKDCYIDGSKFSSSTELFSYIDALNFAEYEVMFQRLQDFLMNADKSRPDESIYSYTIDRWITELTAAIAADAKEFNEVTPLLSIIIPSFNYGRFLSQAIESVLMQGIQSIEVLVMDNASSDNTELIMRQFENDARVRYIRNRRNFGASSNVLNGLAIATGRYFSILMADDFLNSGHFQRLLPILEGNPNVCVAYSPIDWVDEAGCKLAGPVHVGYKPESYVGGRNELVDLLVYDNYITPSAAIIRRAEFNKAWHFNPDLHGAGDWDLMIQLAELFPDFAFVKESGVCYRVHGAQHSAEFYASTAPLEDHIAILEQVLSRGRCHLKLDEVSLIGEHLVKRLKDYPSEFGTDLGDRAFSVLDRLSSLQSKTVPFFSVILSTFNRPKMLRDTLQSLLQQRMPDFEVVLVNDCGSPVEDVLAEFPTLTIAYHRLAKNSGLSAARNAALMIARGRYITYLDDDDFYLPDHLDLLRQQFEKTPNALVYTDSITVQEDIIDGVRHPLLGRNLYAHQGFSRERLLVHNYIPVNTWSHPAKLIAEVGGFDVSLPSFEDWDMLLRMTDRSEVVHLEQITAEVRQRRERSSDQMTSQNRAKFPLLYRRIYGRYPVQSCEILAQRQSQLAALELPPQPSVDEVYGEFLAKRKLNQAELDAYASSLRHYALPLCIVVVHDRDNDDQALVSTLKSIAAQYYQQHQVWVVSERQAAPTDSNQIRWLGFAGLEAALAALPDDGLIGFFAAGDTFEQHTLLLLAHAFLTQSKALIYFDADQVDADGCCHSPQFRAQFDLQLQLSNGYVGRSCVLPVAVLKSLQLDTQLLQFSHLAWWQLVILSVYLQQGVKQIGHLPFVLHHQAKVFDVDADYTRSLLQDYYQLRGQAGRLLSNNGVNLMVAQAISSQTLIAIEAGADHERLLTSIENLLSGIVGLPAVIVVLDRGDEAVVPTLQALTGVAHPQLQILSCPVGFDVLAWLRSMAGDIEWFAYVAAEVAIAQPECMPMMLSTMAMNEAQWVAPRMADAQGRNTGAPLVAGFDDGIKSPLQGMSVTETGYQLRNQSLQQSLLLDPRCLLMRREVLFKPTSSGPDSLLLQLIELQLASFLVGGIALWAPASFASTAIPFEYGLDAVAPIVPQYRTLFATDPFYSPNFQRTGQFLLERNRLAGPDVLAWSQVPKVLVFPADEFGCGYYRLIHPYHVMEQAGLIRGGVGFEHFSVCDLQRIQPDLILVQRQISPEQIASLARYKAWANCPIVFELDDYILNLPVKSLHRDEMPQGMAASLRKALSYCDRLIVSTKPLAEALQGFHSDIRVDANRLPPNWWSFAVEPKQRSEGKPRVGWAGGVGHTGDLLLVADVVAELANEVDWVFFGYCPEALQPYVKEFHPGIEITQYPAKLAALNLDLAIAPLEDNLFNRCKSNLKLLEYGACAYPVVCSDVGPYQGDMPVVRVKNRFKDWVDAIRHLLANHELRGQMAQRLHDEVRANWMLDEAAAAAWCRDWFGQ